MQLQSYTYGDRVETLVDLREALHSCGAWVVERRSLTPSMLELQVEVRPADLMDLYIALLSCGLELTRCAHFALSTGCSAAHFHGCGEGAADTVGLRLQITFITPPAPRHEDMPWRVAAAAA